MQIAQQYPQELGEAATKLEAHVKASPIAAQAAGMADGGAALIANARAEAASSPDLFHMEYAQALQQQVEGRAKRLAEDPHGYAAEVGWIARLAAEFFLHDAPNVSTANASAPGLDRVGKALPRPVLRVKSSQVAGHLVGTGLGLADTVAGEEGAFALDLALCEEG